MTREQWPVDAALADLTAMPVLDNEGMFVAFITIDDALTF